MRFVGGEMKYSTFAWSILMKIQLHLRLICWNLYITHATVAPCPRLRIFMIRTWSDLNFLLDAKDARIIIIKTKKNIGMNIAFEREWRVSGSALHRKRGRSKVLQQLWNQFMLFTLLSYLTWNIYINFPHWTRLKLLKMKASQTCKFLNTSTT